MPQKKKIDTAGGRLIGLLLLIIVLSPFGRHFQNPLEVPAFIVSQGNSLIKLGKGFRQPGVHQIIDASGASTVIELTDGDGPRQQVMDSLAVAVARSGEVFEFIEKGSQKRLLVRSWMPAGQRIALGIPLHPDRMTELDWTALGGVGPVLAHAIEINRQKFGEFRNFNGLQRVKGVGPAFIRKNNKFFRSRN